MHSEEDAPGLEPRPNKRGSCHVVGSLLRRVFWFPAVWGFIAPEKEEFNPGEHLSFKDIAVDNATDPRVISVRIKQSKTDPFRQAVAILLGRTDTAICPVAALLAYLARRGSGDGLLFLL